MKHSNKRSPDYFIAIFMVLFFLQACDHSYLDAPQNMQDYEYNPTFALPLVKTSLSIYEMVESLETIELDEDNLIWLVYDGSLFSRQVSELFTIEDQSSDFSSSFSLNKVQINQTQQTSFPFVLPNSEVIETISFLTGTFNVEVEAQNLLNDGMELEITLRIPNSYNNQGDELVSTFLLTQSNTSHTITLDDYTLSFHNTEEESNFIELEYTMELVNEGTPTSTDYDIVFHQSIIQHQYDEITGYIGSFNFNMGSATIGMDIFNNSVLGNIYFRDPFIRVFADNSLGVPLDLTFAAFFAQNNTNEFINLEFYDEELTPWTLDYPTQAGEVVTTEEVINENNSNIYEVLNIRPNEITYSVMGTTNPEMDPSLKNHIKHNSSLEINAEVNLPMNLRIEEIALEQMLEFSFDTIIDELEWIEIKIDIDNYFPLDGKIQIFFVVDNGEDIKLFETTEEDELVNFFIAADIDTSSDLQRTVSPSRTQLLVRIDAEKLERIAATEEIRLKTSFSSYNNQDQEQYVKIYEDYTIDIQIGAKGQGKYIMEF